MQARKGEEFRDDHRAPGSRLPALQAAEMRDIADTWRLVFAARRRTAHA